MPPRGAPLGASSDCAGSKFSSPEPPSVNVTEPFVELIKGSLHTYVNAGTYPDKTAYPVASTNQRDFHNLVDVYLDAVLHPRIDHGTFKQEGWHYELEAPDAPLPIYEIRKVAGMTEMLVRDQARGRALAQTLGNNPAVLMRGHGVAVVGPDIKFAVGRSIYLEMNARVQLQAMQLGGTITYLDPEEAKAVMAAGENRRYERPWEMWKRKAMGR